MKVYVVHSWSEPEAAFSTKEAAALWIYEYRQKHGSQNSKQI
jgi:hypothetical protein